MTIRGPRRAVAAALLLAPASGGVAVAQNGNDGYVYPPKDEAAARYLHRQRLAIDLINEAQQHVYATMPSCKPALPRFESKPTHDAPSQAVLDVLAALRRPQQPGDLANVPRGLGFGGETYVDFVRSVTSASGERLTIVVGRSVRPVFRPTKRCLDAQHARLVAISRHAPKAVRSLALQEFGELSQGQEQNAA